MNFQKYIHLFEKNTIFVTSPIGLLPLMFLTLTVKYPYAFKNS